MSARTQDSTGPTPGWRLATIGGVPVYIGKSWPIIVVVIVATFGPNVAASRPGLGLGAYAVAVAYAVLLLVSVLAHEAAHAALHRIGSPKGDDPRTEEELKLTMRACVGCRQ